MIHPDLTKLDNREIPNVKDEIRLFGVAYNESLRLPYLLEHYRNLGVGRFFFISNASTDDTNDFLLSQPDCHVYHTAASYAKARAGLAWLNSLMDTYGKGHWIVLSDSDELLVYPGCEAQKLPAFCAEMDNNGEQGLFTVLLDVYSNTTLENVNYKRGESFLNSCSYFDNQYWFVRRMGIPFLRPAFPSKEIVGGPRHRLCFPNQYTPKLWPRLKPKLVKAAHKMGFLKNVIAETPAPQAFKIPLVKWQEGYAFITSHRLNPIRLASHTGALLHFKYFQDFAHRVAEAVSKGSHYDGSIEYKKYAEILSKDKDFSMHFSGSVRYTDSSDLVKYGIAKTSIDWS